MRLWSQKLQKQANTKFQKKKGGGVLDPSWLLNGFRLSQQDD